VAANPKKKLCGADFEVKYQTEGMEATWARDLVTLFGG